MSSTQYAFQNPAQDDTGALALSDPVEIDAWFAANLGPYTYSYNHSTGHVIYSPSTYVGDTWQSFTKIDAKIKLAQSGTYSGDVTHFAFAPDTVEVTPADPPLNQDWRGASMSDDGKYQFVYGVQTGLYMSSDFGVTFTLHPDLPFVNYEHVAVSPDGQYIRAFGRHVMMSSNYGVDWYQVPTGTGGNNINWVGGGITDDGLTSVSAWPGAVNGAAGVYYSVVSELGVVNTMVHNTNVPSLLAWLDISGDGTYQTAVETDGAIWSTDGGVAGEWTPISGFDREWTMIKMSTSGQYRIASNKTNGELFISSAFGVEGSWINTSPVTNTYFDKVSMNRDGNLVLAGTLQGDLYSSSDYGNNWTLQQSFETTVHTRVQPLALSEDGSYVLLPVRGTNIYTGQYSKSVTRPLGTMVDMVFPLTDGLEWHYSIDGLDTLFVQGPITGPTEATHVLSNLNLSTAFVDDTQLTANVFSVIRDSVAVWYASQTENLEETGEADVNVNTTVDGDTVQVDGTVDSDLVAITPEAQLILDEIRDNCEKLDPDSFKHLGQLSEYKVLVDKALEVKDQTNLLASALTDVDMNEVTVLAASIGTTLSSLTEVLESSVAINDIDILTEIRDFVVGFYTLQVELQKFQFQISLTTKINVPASLQMAVGHLGTCKDTVDSVMEYMKSFVGLSSTVAAEDTLMSDERKDQIDESLAALEAIKSLGSTIVSDFEDETIKQVQALATAINADTKTALEAIQLAMDAQIATFNPA